jgi:hypothetical protein
MWLGHGDQPMALKDAPYFLNWMEPHSIVIQTLQRAYLFYLFSDIFCQKMICTSCSVMLFITANFDIK